MGNNLSSFGGVLGNGKHHVDQFHRPVLACEFARHIGRRQVEQQRAGFVRHRVGQHGLARALRAVQQDGADELRASASGISTCVSMTSRLDWSQ